jgi:hypothetical protein
MPLLSKIVTAFAFLVVSTSYAHARVPARPEEKIAPRQNLPDAPRLTMKQQSDAILVMDRWQDAIFGVHGKGGLVPGVVGFGLNDDGRGNPLIHIQVSKLTPEVAITVPTNLDGIPVVVEEMPYEPAPPIIG